MQLVKLNAIDRLVGVFDPESALRRARARAAMAYFSSDGGYVGVDRQRSAMRAVNPRNTSPDGATLTGLDRNRAISRDLVRNNPLAGGAVNTVTTSVVGTGLSVKPVPQAALLGLSDEAARAWGDEVRALFELWAERAEWCDVGGRLNFYELQELAFRSALESGDSFALLPMGAPADSPVRTQVQLIEADRICNPELRADTRELAGGVRIDIATGRFLSAFIADRHPGDYLGKPTEWREVRFMGAEGRRNLLQLADITRPGQRRAVPYLAPVIEPLKQLGTYTEAEITAAVVSGMFTAFVKSEGGQTGGTSPGAAGAGAGSPPVASNEVAMGPGAIVGLATGEDVEFADPARPNANFEPFVLAVLQQIGVRLELPVEVLIKHFRSSYSAARASLLEAWRFFKKRRVKMAWQFCQPVYEAVVLELVASGRISAPGMFSDPMLRAAWLRATWIGDAPGAIDPEKEVKAAARRVSMGISTLDAESIAFDGVGWADKHPQRVREAQARREAGLEAAATAGAGATDDTTSEDGPDAPDDQEAEESAQES